MRLLIGALFSLVFSLHAAADSRNAEVSVGHLDKIESFASEFVAARDVHVWLPAGYSSSRKYAVLYMHDGQMLFDAGVTWNKQEWGVDEVAQDLINSGALRDFIVVGVFNGGELRHQEYFPEKVYRMLPRAKQEALYGFESNKLQADEYLKFLVRELKPYIDKTYSVHTDAANTAVMGSSMGGLISMYAISEYPNVFGQAACLSTHWPGIDPKNMGEVPDVFLGYMRENLPPPANHRIYFDFGDQTLDAHYPPLQARVDMLMTELGYDGSNWQTIFDAGANHSEEAWRNRLPGVLGFLFGK